MIIILSDLDLGLCIDDEDFHDGAQLFIWAERAICLSG